MNPDSQSQLKIPLDLPEKLDVALGILSGRINPFDLDAHGHLLLKTEMQMPIPSEFYIRTQKDEQYIRKCAEEIIAETLLYLLSRFEAQDDAQTVPDTYALTYALLQVIAEREGRGDVLRRQDIPFDEQTFKEAVGAGIFIFADGGVRWGKLARRFIRRYEQAHKITTSILTPQGDNENE